MTAIPLPASGSSSMPDETQWPWEAGPAEAPRRTPWSVREEPTRYPPGQATGKSLYECVLDHPVGGSGAPRVREWPLTPFASSHGQTVVPLQGVSENATMDDTGGLSASWMFSKLRMSTCNPRVSGGRYESCEFPRLESHIGAISRLGESWVLVYSAPCALVGPQSCP